MYDKGDRPCKKGTEYTPERVVGLIQSRGTCKYLNVLKF